MILPPVTRRVWNAVARLPYLGGNFGVADELAQADPRLAQYVARQRSEARRRFAFVLCGLAFLTAASIWYALGQSTLANIFDTAAFALTGAALARWRSSVTVTARTREEIQSLGSIFYQSPEILGRLLRDEVLDEFLRNLLRTVLHDADLGESLWQQAVSPLLDAVAEGAWRKNMRYRVLLKTMKDPLTAGSQTNAVTLTGEDWILLESNIEYERTYPSAPRTLWVGVLFGPAGGEDWWQSQEFCLREYSPLADVAQVALGSWLEAPASVGPEGRLTPNLRTRWQARRTRTWRIEQALALASPSLTIDEVELPVRGAGSGTRGLAVSFAVDADLRRRMKAGAPVSIRASMTIPVPKWLTTFPIVCAEPVRGMDITFDRGDISMRDVRVDTFFSVNQPFRRDRTRSSEGRVAMTTEPHEWLFAGDGFTVSWRL